MLRDLLGLASIRFASAGPCILGDWMDGEALDGVRLREGDRKSSRQVGDLKDVEIMGLPLN